MSRTVWLLLSLLELSRITLATDERTDDHLVIRIIPKTKAQLDYLVQLERNAGILKLDFWKGPKSIDLPVDLMIEQAAKSTLLSEMRAKDIQFSPMINSVEEWVKKLFFLIFCEVKKFQSEKIPQRPVRLTLTLSGSLVNEEKVSMVNVENLHYGIDDSADFFNSFHNLGEVFIATSKFKSPKNF